MGGISTWEQLANRTNRDFEQFGRIKVRFFKHPEYQSFRSTQEGRAIYADKDYVEFSIPGGDKHVKRVTENDIMEYPEHWKQYQQGNSVQRVGTPIEEWPGVTRGQAEELKFLGVDTVDILAQAADTVIQQFMGGFAMREKARAFLATAKNSAAAEAFAAENALLKAELDEMKKEIRKLSKAAQPIPVKENEVNDGKRN